MSRYTIPALSFANEFADLAWLGKYVDLLVASRGDANYAVVHEWEDDLVNRWPPVAVLVRRGGQWFRRRVLVDPKRWPNGYTATYLNLADEELVNDH